METMVGSLVFEKCNFELIAIHIFKFKLSESDRSYLELRMSQKSGLRPYVINQVPKVFLEKKIEISLKLKGVQISYYMIKEG